MTSLVCKRLPAPSQLLQGVRWPTYLPQEYTVDDQDGIDDPRGMLGARLSVSVHIVTSPVATKQNIVNCVNRANLNVADIYLVQLASAEAVLSDDDKGVWHGAHQYRW
jgi:cell division protein FtsA